VAETEEGTSSIASPINGWHREGPFLGCWAAVLRSGCHRWWCVIHISKGVAGCNIGDGGAWVPVSPSSEEEDKMGGVVIRSRRLCSSLWTVLWVLGTWRWSTTIIVLLKEGQGPCPKEEVTGSETASHCSIPYSVKCVMECTTGAGPEAVVMKWTLPYFAFIRKNQLFLFHLTTSYYILFLLF